jgi:hypothetical protein
MPLLLHIVYIIIQYNIYAPEFFFFFFFTIGPGNHGLSHFKKYVKSV